MPFAEAEILDFHATMQKKFDWYSDCRKAAIEQWSGRAVEQ
jgi:hypothetical protein